jgi:hypothetical protein
MGNSKNAEAYIERIQNLTRLSSTERNNVSGDSPFTDEGAHVFGDISPNRDRAFDLGELRKFTDKIPVGQRPILWERAVRSLELRIARAKRVGPISSMRVNIRRLKDIKDWLGSMPMQPSVAEKILRPKRLVCRFTGKCHASIAEEVEAVQIWRDGIVRIHKELGDKFRALTSDSAPEDRYDLHLWQYTAQLRCELSLSRFKVLLEEASSEGMAGLHEPPSESMAM